MQDGRGVEISTGQAPGGTRGARVQNREME